MKVYQIISEAAFIPATPAELAMMDPNQLRKYRRAETNAKRAATATAQQQAKASSDSKARRAAASKMRYQKDKPVASKVSDIKQAAADKLKTTGPVGKKVAKIFEPGTKPEDAYKILRDKAANDPVVKSLADKLYKSKFAWGVRVILNVIQVSTSLMVLSEDRALIDNFEKIGEFDANTAQNMRDYAFRKFSLEVTAAIAGSIGTVYIARAVLTVIRFILGAAGIASGIGAGVTITAAIASEVAIHGFVAFIKTNAGAQYMADFLAGVLIDDDALVQRGLGAIMNAIGMSSTSSTKRLPTTKSTNAPAGATSDPAAGSPSNPVPTAPETKNPDVEAAIRSLEK
jgi:hypothetical protein